jgi:hypothetical protein
MCKKSIERIIKSMKKKQNNFKSPELAQLQEVVIDFRTRIFIALGADPKEARNRFISRFGYKVL